MNKHKITIVVDEDIRDELGTYQNNRVHFIDIDEEVMDFEKSCTQDPRWIPVSERLPEDGQNVLFCDNDGYIMVGYHIKGRPGTHFSQDGTYEDMKNVTAWMPLPEPYSESKYYAELAKSFAQGVQAGFAESEE